MKFIAFWAILLLIICSSASSQVTVHTSAPYSCSRSFTFNNGCSSTVPGYLTWTDNCGSGWTRSHGDPQMIGDASVPFFVFMAAQNTNGPTVGQGLFETIHFYSGNTYMVTISMGTGPDPSFNHPGKVYVVAANGLQQGQLNGEMNTPPQVSSAQVIGVFEGYLPLNNYPGDPFSWLFTANTDYTQLWIYCESEASSDQQFRPEFGDVSVCTCFPTNSVTYNSGSLPINITAAGTIIAGSGNAGTVNNDPAENTTFVANNEIDLVQNFNASFTGSGSFSAFTLPCRGARAASVTSVAKPADNSARHATWAITPNAITTATPSGLLIYPTVSSGRFTITGGLDLLANASIVVTDGSGRVVYRLQNDANTTVGLNLDGLGNGLYFVQIINRSKISTQKIIISK